MRNILLLSTIIAVVALSGCGANESTPDAAMPPAASKAAGESRASASGGAQFGRSSDKADGS